MTARGAAAAVDAGVDEATGAGAPHAMTGATTGAMPHHAAMAPQPDPHAAMVAMVAMRVAGRAAGPTTAGTATTMASGMTTPGDRLIGRLIGKARRPRVVVAAPR